MSSAIRHIASILAVVALLSLPARAAANSEVCLESVGGTSAGYVYSTYMFIGVTADAFRAKVYDAKRVKQLMSVGIKMMAEAEKQLGKLKKSGLSKEDRYAVEEFKAILGLLQDQARALNVYAGSRSAKDAQRFEKCRERAWRRITKLLGIEEKS